MGNNNDELGLGLEQKQTTKTSESIEQKPQGYNTIATLLKVIGVIVIIAGVIASLGMRNFVFIIGGTVSGIVFIGFGEIIKLLQILVDKSDMNK